MELRVKSLFRQESEGGGAGGVVVGLEVGDLGGGAVRSKMFLFGPEGRGLTPVRTREPNERLEPHRTG